MIRTEREFILDVCACVRACVRVCVCVWVGVRVNERKREEKLENEERLNNPNFLKLKMSNVLGPIQHMKNFKYIFFFASSKVSDVVDIHYITTVTSHSS